MRNYGYYEAFGLTIASYIPLPQLEETASTKADLTVSPGKIDWQPPKDEEIEGYRHWQIEEDEVYFYWKCSGKYLLKSCREIIVDPFADLDDEGIIALPIIGPLLGMLLHQRGFYVLHGSGVKVGNEACIFLGCKGQGKSTMAATMCDRGYPLVADDISAISFDTNGGLVLTPGFPQIRLWPDAVEAAVGENPEELPKIYPTISKRSYKTKSDRFYDKPLPLKRIYILGSADGLEIKSLNPQEAIKQLVGNSYVPMMLGKDFAQCTNATKHFFDCAKVANQVAVCSLDRPRDLSLLPEIAEYVAQDLKVLATV